MLFILLFMIPYVDGPRPRGLITLLEPTLNLYS